MQVAPINSAQIEILKCKALHWPNIWLTSDQTAFLMGNFAWTISQQNLFFACQISVCSVASQISDCSFEHCAMQLGKGLKWPPQSQGSRHDLKDCIIKRLHFIAWPPRLLFVYELNVCNQLQTSRKIYRHTKHTSLPFNYIDHLDISNATLHQFNKTTLHASRAFLASS